MMTEEHFYEIVEAVSANPRLYTENGTYQEAISFLEGYGIGANVGNIQSHSKFEPFHRWISLNFSLGSHTKQWGRYRNLFPSDSDALENLPKLYKKYLKERS